MSFLKRKKIKGFTLIEVLIALFIFSIMMVAASRVFASAFNGYRFTRAIQRDTENAQFSLNILAKELRTSSIVSPSSGPFPINSQYVQFYDHSQSVCFHYRINGGTLQVARASVATVAACSTASPSPFTTISSGTVTGRFMVTPSAVGPPIRVGKITISLELSQSANHRARIQTSTSLRDYGNIGL